MVARLPTDNCPLPSVHQPVSALQIKDCSHGRGIALHFFGRRLVEVLVRKFFRRSQSRRADRLKQFEILLLGAECRCIIAWWVSFECFPANLSGRSGGDSLNHLMSQGTQMTGLPGNVITVSMRTVHQLSVCQITEVLLPESIAS